MSVDNKIKFNELVVQPNGKSFLSDTKNGVIVDTSDASIKKVLYGNVEYIQEQYCKSIEQHIPKEMKNEYCLLFGTRVLAHSLIYEDIVKQRDDFSNHGVTTAIYMPAINK